MNPTLKDYQENHSLLLQFKVFSLVSPESNKNMNSEKVKRKKNIDCLKSMYLTHLLLGFLLLDLKILDHMERMDI